MGDVSGGSGGRERAPDPWEGAPSPYLGGRPGTAPPLVLPQSAPRSRFAPMSLGRPLRVLAVVLVIAAVVVGTVIAVKVLRNSPSKTVAALIADYQAGQPRKACTLFADKTACVANLGTDEGATFEGLKVAAARETPTQTSAVVLVTGTYCPKGSTCLVATQKAFPPAQRFSGAWSLASSGGQAPHALYVALVNKGGNWYVAGPQL